MYVCALVPALGQVSGGCLLFLVCCWLGLSDFDFDFVFHFLCVCVCVCVVWGGGGETVRTREGKESTRHREFCVNLSLLTSHKSPEQGLNLSRS
jgi:hypothetical protein